MSDEAHKRTRRAVAMVDRAEAVPAAAPKQCAGCAERDARLDALRSELADVRRSLLVLQRQRG